MDSHELPLQGLASLKNASTNHLWRKVETSFGCVCLCGINLSSYPASLCSSIWLPRHLAVTFRLGGSNCLQSQPCIILHDV